MHLRLETHRLELSLQQSVTPHKPIPRSVFASISNWLSNVPLIGIHLAPLGIFFTGVNGTDLLLCLGCYLIHMFGITAGYHRYFAHRSYKTSRPFQFVLAWLGCTAFEKGPLWWAAHHRQHHRHSDQEGDVHSPVVRSVWWSHIGWLLDPECQATKIDSIRDMARYPELRWLGRNYWLPPVMLAGACYLIGGWSGLLWGGAIATLLSLHAVFLVNSMCHLWGKRRFASGDESRNNALVAILTLGEGWHNNHHHYQSSARQGFRWWEYDFSYYVIRCFGLVGLVWDIRQPPREKLTTNSSTEKADAQAKLSV